MRSWKHNWDASCPIFKFSSTVRKVIYTTNAIESLNATYRKLNHQRSVFPSDTALLKALYLSTFESTKKWTMPIRNWGQVYGELSEHHVRGTSAGIGLKIPPLEQAMACAVYINQGLKASKSAFSPNIIMEDLLLQRFLHTLIFEEDCV